MVEALSEVIGWGYFLSWSVSFYPQLYTNYHLHSWSGYLAYSLYNILLYMHPSYGHATVQDLVFAVHGWNLWRRTSLFVKGAKVVLWMLAFLFFSLQAKGVLHPSVFFSAVKWLGYMKVCTTVIKYAPQVYLNWCRSSTQGWSGINVLFDFMGGLLSVVQIVLDSADKGNWSPGSSEGLNVAKFTLGFVTMAFDLIFAYQFHRYRLTTKSDSTLNLLPAKQP